VTTGPRALIEGHLILVGLPGAGKSTIGRQVAKRLGRPFFDFDAEIERRTGMSVPRIFAEQGEASFRAVEIQLTRELVGAPPMVLAPGGGWVTNDGVMALLRPPGRIIHLRVSPAEALRRLTKSRFVRPLLAQADPAAKIQSLWDTRKALYEQADDEVNVEGVVSQQVIESVAALARTGTSGIG
jgi:shikimate kinase